MVKYKLEKIILGTCASWVLTVGMMSLTKETKKYVPLVNEVYTIATAGLACAHTYKIVRRNLDRSIYDKNSTNSTDNH